MNTFLIEILFIFSVCTYVSSVKLPSNLKRCNLKDIPCLKDAIQDAIPKMKDGIPELGVASFDPISIPKMSIDASGPVQLVQNYENVELFGLTDFKLNDLVFDLDKGKLEMDFDGPMIQFNATYTIKGKILVMDVYGTGKNMIQVEKLKGKLTLDVEVFTKDGQKYMKTTKGRFPLTAEHVAFKFDNLFDGNKELLDNINLVLNDNWKELWDELEHGYANVIIEQGIIIGNKIFSQVPMSEIFLDQ